MSAVSEQTRAAEKIAHSDFIDQNKDELANVSRMNLERAFQIKKQFLEQREKINKKFSDKLEQKKTEQNE